MKRLFCPYQIIRAPVNELTHPFEELCIQFKIYNTERIHSALKMAPDAFFEKVMREQELQKSAQQSATV